LSCNRYQM